MRQTVAVIALLIAGSLGANALSGGIFNVMDYGAHGNGIKLSDGAMTSGSALLTSASANFTSADVGKLIMVPGGSSANITLTALINAVNSPTSVTLSAAATASINGAAVYYGTDDTPAIQNAWNAARGSGGTVLFPAAIYLVENTIFGSLNNNTQLSGYGATIIFCPILPLTPAVNDRLFYVLSGTTSIRQIGIGPIAVGATSFTVQNTSDASDLAPGDWLLIGERDSSVGDVVIEDWAQVASVVGNTINVVNPFRTAFPNVRPWTGGSNSFGLGFRRILPAQVTHDITVSGLTLISPDFGPINVGAAVCMVTFATLRVRVENMNFLCGQAFASYQDKGLQFVNNYVGSTPLHPEFAADVDLSIQGNHFESIPSGLNDFDMHASGVQIDLGTGFFAFTGNTITNAIDIGLELDNGTRDGSILANELGWVRKGGNNGSSGIIGRGNQRLMVIGNALAGGDPGASSYGISLGTSANMSVNIVSTGNIVANNNVGSFTLPYDVASAGDQLIQSTPSGGLATKSVALAPAANGTDLLTATRFTDTNATGNFINFKALSGVSLFMVDINGNAYAPGFGDMVGHGLFHPLSSTLRLGNNGVVFWSSTPFYYQTADIGISRAGAGLLAVGNSQPGDTSATIVLNGINLTPTSFQGLGSANTNGTIKYCSDCQAAPVCTGNGSGAIAKAINYVWVCN